MEKVNYKHYGFMTNEIEKNNYSYFTVEGGDGDDDI